VRLPSRADIYKPIAIKLEGLDWFGPFNYSVIGHLKPGVARQQAVSELTVLQRAVAARLPDKAHLGVLVRELQEEVTGASRTPLLILFGAVGAVLLIVCVNLANLALARGAARSRDLAIRLALGAARGQLIRHVLAESVCLACVGGTLGTMVAWAGLTALLSRAPLDLPRLNEIRLDGRVLVFTFGLSLVTGVLFGLLPAWRAAAIDPQRSLRDGSRTTTDGRSGRLIRNALVAIECGLGAALLIVAGLLMVSFFHLLNVDKGFDAERLLTTQLTVSPNRYGGMTARQAYFREVLGNLQVIPGVTSASIVSHLPLEGEDWVDLVQKEGDRRPTVELPPANYRFCSAEYFRAMGIRLVGGTTFTEADRNRHLAVISEATARAVWPNENPVGKKFKPSTEHEPLIEVAGVVRDVSVGLGSKTVATVYLPYWSVNENLSMNVVLRSAADPRAVARSVRQAVWNLDRDTVVGEMRTMDDVVSNSVAGRRFQVLLIGGFAGSALLLACLGIYGVVAWSVARRRNEIGVRMALGAASDDVRRMVVGQGMRPVFAGLALGVIGALALGRVLGSMLFSVSARDPLTIGVVVVTLTVVAMLACYVPARRATLADPLRALRYE
jgi:putative ABC transport system permease protein